MSLIVPDIILQNTLDAILATIKANWDNNVDKTQTALYRMWNGVSHGDYDYYVQAQSVFLKTGINQRRVKVRPSYPKDKQDFPCITVNVPNESTGSQNSIGFDLNAADPIFGVSDYTQNTSRSFDFVYSVVIYSDNRNEVNLIYHTLKAFFIIKDIYEHLALSGFENLKISGREMQRMDDIPNGTFIRALQLSGFTSQTVDELTAQAMLSDLNFNGLANGKLSAQDGTLNGLSNLTYVGGQGNSILRLTWTDNSDTSGSANGDDSLFVTIYNITQDEWLVSDGEAIRSSEIIDIPLTEPFQTDDELVIVANFIRDNMVDSEKTELIESFVE